MRESALLFKNTLLVGVQLCSLTETVVNPSVNDYKSSALAAVSTILVSLLPAVVLVFSSYIV